MNMANVLVDIDKAVTVVVALVQPLRKKVKTQVETTVILILRNLIAG